MPTQQPAATWRQVGLETVLVALCLCALTWAWPPDVNEAHYLVKARHFWDREFCANDLFAASHETHWLFYATHGWLGRFVEFETMAWTGRVFANLVIAWGFVLLIRSFWTRSWLSLVIAPLVVVLNLHLNLAGEWFVGGVEGKCYAYGFSFAAMAMWFRHQYHWMWVCLGFACAFHIVAGLWVLIAILFAIGIRWIGIRGLPQGRKAEIEDADRGVSLSHVGAKTQVSTALLALLLFSIGFFPAITQNASATHAIVVQASKLQLLTRLAHHQLATGFDRWVLFLPLLMIWAVLANANRNASLKRLSQLNLATLGAVFIALCGIALSLIVQFAGDGPLVDWSARILTLYMFRLADVMVPLAATINAFIFVQQLPRYTSLGRVFMSSCLVVTGVAICFNVARNRIDHRSGSARQSVAFPENAQTQKREIEAEANWIRTCRWIRMNTPRDAVFITPERQQTFKWYAHRAEIACWKDMPQDANSVIRWHERRELMYRGIDLTNQRADQAGITDWPPADYFYAFGPLAFRRNLPLIAEPMGARFLVVEQRVVDHFLNYFELPDSFQQLYPQPGKRKSTFVVFQTAE